MISQSNNDDITGIVEDIVDEKIAQIDILTPDYVESRIDEITKASGTFDPKMLDDYATINFVNENNAVITSLFNNYPTKSDVSSEITRQMANYAPNNHRHNKITDGVSELSIYDNQLTTTATFSAPNIYTKDEVDAKIAEIPSGGGGSEFDPSILNDYATISYVNDKIANISGASINPSLLDNYATISYVNDKIANISNSLIDYATISYVNDNIANISNSLIDYATISYVNETISSL